MSTVFDRTRDFKSKRKGTQFPPEYFQIDGQTQKFGQGVTYYGISDPALVGPTDKPDKGQHGFFTHSDDPQNVGFSFTPNGSELRPGKHLQLSTQYTKIYMRGMTGGKLQFHPLAAILPSTAVNPYTVLLELPPVEELQNLANLTEALGV